MEPDSRLIRRRGLSRRVQRYARPENAIQSCDVPDIRERIAVQQHQVGNFTGRDSACVFVAADHLLCVDRRRPQGLHRRQASFHVQDNFEQRCEPARRIAARHDRDTRVIKLLQIRVQHRKLTGHCVRHVEVEAGRLQRNRIAEKLMDTRCARSFG